MNLSKNKKIIIPALVVLIIVGLVSWRIFQGQSEETIEETKMPEVETVKLANYKEEESDISSIGKIEALEEVTLSAQMSAQIKGVEVNIGDKVETGQLLIELDHSSLDSELSKANASIERLEGNLAQQKAGATEQQIKQAQKGVEQARAGLEQTQASLEQTRANNRAMIKNAEIGVELAKSSLENTTTSSEQTLENAYDSLKLTASNILSTIRTALTASGDILGKKPGDEKANDLYEDYLGVKDFDSLNQAEIKFNRAKNDYEEAFEYNQNLGDTIAVSQGEKLDNLVGQALDSIDETLSSVRIVLDNTVTNNNFPKSSVSGTSLDGLKSQIDTQISYINQAQQNLQIQKQAVANAKISNQGNTEQTSLNYQQALQNLEDTKTQAEANLEAARKAVQTQEKALEQAQSSLEQVTAPPREVDLTSTKAAIKEAQAGRNLVLNQLSKAYVRAPFSGEVASVPANLNEFISTGDPLISLVNKNGLQVKSYLNSEDVKLIQEGSKAVIEEEISGVISNISPQVDPETKKIEVITVVTEKDSPLITGEYVEVKFRINKDENTENVYFLPFKSIKITGEGNYVFTVNSEEKIEAHKVNLGRVVNDLNEVYNGLTPDMEIITNVRGLSKGQEVKIKE